MLLTPLLIAAIETFLNHLFKDRSMKAAKLRLAGKVLRIELQELSAPLTLVFSEHKIDVVGQSQDLADCTLRLRLSVLHKLHDRQQLSALMRDGELIVDGDIQVMQQFAALLDMSEWDLAEWLSPYIGDIAAHSLTQTLGCVGRFLAASAKKHQNQLAQAVTEEWKLAPGVLETAWFSEEVSATKRQVDQLETRLNQLEANL